MNEFPELPGPIDRGSAPHYAWGEGCDGWHLLQRESLSVIAERMPAGMVEHRHRHARAEQFFFVLSGELTVEREGLVHVLSAGVGLNVPPGVAHEVRNTGPSAAEFLVISQPPSHNDRQSAP